MRWLATCAGGAFALLPAVAGAIVPGGFDATDGNLVILDPGGTTDVRDWENLHTFGVTTAVGFDLPAGQTDDSFGQGTKSDTPVPVVVNGSIPKNKSDFDRFYAASEVLFDSLNGRDEVLFYVAWIRNNTLGSANFNIELNQSSDVSANDVTPVRTAGDILITFDFASGGNKVELGLLYWLDATGDPSQCFASSAVPCWGQFVDLDSAGVAEGGVNFGFDVLDPIANPDVTVGDSRFGEAAINMTDAGILSTDQCSGFAAAYVISRSSDSFTSAAKDFIAPIPAPFNLCGSITVRKLDDAGGFLSGALFYLYAADGASDTDPTDDVTGEPLATCTTGATGTCAFPELDNGSYWLIEASGPSGYCVADPAYQRVDLASNADVTVDFGNFRIYTVITLVCAGNQLVASPITLDGAEKTSLGTSAIASTLCALGGARYQLPAGTYPGQVKIAKEDCGTAADDDGDGLVNGADPDCVFQPQCAPELCGNTLDDDGDALIDCADPDCACP